MLALHVLHKVSIIELPMKEICFFMNDNVFVLSHHLTFFLHPSRSLSLSSCETNFRFNCLSFFQFFFLVQLSMTAISLPRWRQRRLPFPTLKRFWSAKMIIATVSWYSLLAHRPLQTINTCETNVDEACLVILEQLEFVLIALFLPLIVQFAVVEYVFVIQPHTHTSLFLIWFH